jgi:hypothetical protein
MVSLKYLVIRYFKDTIKYKEVIMGISCEKTIKDKNYGFKLCDLLKLNDEFSIVARCKFINESGLSKYIATFFDEGIGSTRHIKGGHIVENSFYANKDFLSINCRYMRGHR